MPSTVNVGFLLFIDLCFLLEKVVKNTHYLNECWLIREKSSSYLLRCSSLSPPTLRRKLQLFALQHLGNVEVEEIAVQDRLDGSGEDRDQIVVSLGVVPVDPVEQIQGTVRTQREQVMAGNALRLARFADEEQLGQDGHRLQVDRERPEHLQRREAGVDQQGQHEARQQQELDAERIVIVVVGRLELHVHHVDGGNRGGDEDQLHQRIVQANVRRHQIQIAAHVNDGEQDLRFAGDASARPGLPYFYQQQDNS